ncbi:MAG: biosynthetic-type acetolactate synthase large subunit [Syntrophales bacterium]|jgi:acetolactate synthase-1/2/3 large subunit|nr:biosynthetic-type acetolactate synthase large subunit [Syntrophales bacterium]MDY0043698.1 biosynthetic-type acetolactate synthase large subunit [Syntrophales bacterium]
MERSGAEILLQTLKEAGVEHIFGYPGANTLPVHDCLEESRIRHFLVRHEQAAAHAADGYARATGKIGVCLATSGPGATNLVTGIATAYMDSTPMIALTGQVTTNLLGSDAFQETDIIGITMPITKHSFLLTNENEIAATVREAVHIATTGRPGPVLIDMPRDILAKRTNSEEQHNFEISDSKAALLSDPDRRQLQQIARYLNAAEKPVLIIGGGVKLASAFIEMTNVITKGKIPFVTTMMGIGSVASTNGFNLGFIGTHGNDLANRIVHQSDFILAIGARFSDRSTSVIEEFAPLAKIAQIDVDPTSIGKNIKTDMSVICDIKVALDELITLIDDKERSDWWSRIKNERIQLKKNGSANGCGPAGDLIEQVQEAMPEKTIAVTDVGLNQIWTVRSWKVGIPRGLITSGGMGTMGFSVPAAMGAKIGASDREVVVFTGDGGFFMNIQELATISSYNLPLKIVVFNNGHLGMIRQIQDLFYNSRFRDSCLAGKIDISQISKGFGIPSEKVSVRNAGEGIQRMTGTDGPFILEVLVDEDNYVYPIIPPGRSNMEMIYGRSD